MSIFSIFANRNSATEKELQREQKALDAFAHRMAKSPIWFEFGAPFMQKYYITCENLANGSKYQNLEADFVVRVFSDFVYEKGHIRQTRDRIKSYSLKSFQWPNGGVSEFYPFPSIPLHTPTVVTNKDGHAYRITLKDEKVEIPRDKEEIERYNRLDRHKHTALTAVKRAFTKTEVDISSLAQSVADFHKEIDEEICKVLATKKHSAPTAAAELSRMTKKLHETEKKLRTLEYQQMIYETIFPQLKTFKTFKKNELKRLLKSELTDEARAILAKAESAALEVLNNKKPPHRNGVDTIF